MGKGDYTVDQVISKAQTLIEALPYIKKFQGKTIVVKYGGSAMLDENLKYNVIEDVALLKLVGLKPVIVHGGGKEISKWVEKIGKEPEFINGLRVTDGETMEIAEMVLSKVNKSLVSMMQKVGLKAVGISGKDGGLFTVKKRLPGGKDIGYVGEITKVDTEVIDALVDQDFIPVIAPIGVSEEYEDYNINADDAACAVASALNAEKLAFMTDIEGVCMDPNDKSTFISILTLNEANKMIKDGFIGGGMLPKLRNCIDAVKNGVSRVHILDGRKEHCLLLEFFTKKGIGTAIIDNQTSLYAHEAAQK